MRYCTNIAEQPFKTGPTGERLLFLSGPWSRPYVVPDAETELRLHRKLVWQRRIVLGAVVVALPLAFLKFPPPVSNEGYLVAGLAALMAATWLICRLVLWSDIGHLSRAPNVTSPIRFYGETATKHSCGALMLALVTCVAFVAIGVWLFATGAGSVIAFLSTAFFGLSGIAWGYALWLKMAQ